MMHYFMRDEKNRKWVEVGTPKLADMVSVVRCRDCKHYERDKCCELFVFADDRISHVYDQDGFCAWGERGES